MVIHQQLSGKRRRGFTLLELSIVMVIIGLLAGGVVAGQALIRSAEISSIAKDHQRYTTALMAFRGKFNTMPGDANNVTNVLGYAGGAGCVTRYFAPVSATGVCDGDGNGRIGLAAAASEAGENFQFWRHMAAAGVIDAWYSGVAGAGSGDHAQAGKNIPTTRISDNSGWHVRDYGSITADPQYPDGYYGNSFEVGFERAAADPTGPLFKPAELWRLDTKLDDGIPARGKLVAGNFMTCSNASSSADTAAIYQGGSNSLSCFAMFRDQF